MSRKQPNPDPPPAPPKPRVGWCWFCGRRLWGRHHAVVVVDGHERIAHKDCAKRHEKEASAFGMEY